MKKFIAPTIDLIKINPADIIATSLGISKDTTIHYDSTTHTPTERRFPKGDLMSVHQKNDSINKRIEKLNLQGL